jgi:hypothetical protein
MRKERKGKGVFGHIERSVNALAKCHFMCVKKQCKVKEFGVVTHTHTVCRVYS